MGAYTPDGALGRVLLASMVAPVAFVSFWFAIVGFAAPGLLSGLLGLFYGALTIGGALLTLVLLWPVYLSSIGQLESTADYGTATRDGTASERDERDPVAVLKREYAAGELSEVEFERRLERVLGVEAVERAGIRTGSEIGTELATETRDSTRELADRSVDRL